MRGTVTAAAAALCAVAAPAGAQVVSPMQQEATPRGDRATASFIVANPYTQAQRSEFFVVSGSGDPIPGVRLSARRRTMAAGAQSRLVVSVPTPSGPRPVRTAYVCHTITPRYSRSIGAGTSFKGEVCAKLVIG